MVELAAFATQYADAMAQTTGLLVAITDRDQVIAVAGGSKKEMLQKPVSRQLEQAVTERSVIVAGRDEKAYIPVIQEELEITAQVVVPIICEGDAIGAVAILSREPRAKFSDMGLKKLAQTAAGFLGRQMES